MRQAAARALGALGEHAAPHVGAIAARLEDDYEDMRYAAVQALIALGEHAAAPHAGAIVASIVQTLEGVFCCDEEVEDVAETLRSLGEHGGPQVGAIAALLEHDNCAARWAAVRALGALGEHAAPDVGTIASWLARELDALAPS